MPSAAAIAIMDALNKRERLGIASPDDRTVYRMYSIKCDRCGAEFVKAIIGGIEQTSCNKCAVTQGYKKDAGKPRPELLGFHAIEGVARVLAYGANKYTDDNWRLGMSWRRVAGAALRHLFAYMRGEDLDPETGMPHIDHFLCNAIFLSEYFHTKTGVDDRWKGTPDDSTKAREVPPVVERK